MSNDKPMTLADARSRAETMARMNEARIKDFPGNINAGQWRVDAQMFRLLLAAAAEGPKTHNAPTGAGDYDIVCDGCGEIVADPHSWAECTKGLRERLRGALDVIASADHARDTAVEAERQACAQVALDIFVGNTEKPIRTADEAKMWNACAEFIYDEIRGRE
jgi:hypothetical protein